MISAFETYGVGWVDKKEGDHMDDLGIDGSRVLKLILKK
jgi:hypothetical protein